MTRPVRLALGAASILPALAYALAPRISDAAAAASAGAELWIGATLALLAAALAATLAFAWLAAGRDEQGDGWRLAWAVGLVLFGAVLAPVYWVLYVRPARPVTA